MSSGVLIIKDHVRLQFGILSGDDRDCISCAKESIFLLVVLRIIGNDLNRSFEGGVLIDR